MSAICRRVTITDVAQLTGPIETTLCDFETIESVNEELFNNLSDLVKTPFFRYFQVGIPVNSGSVHYIHKPPG